MRVIRVNPEDRSAIRRFIDFPFRLYKDDPYWVPPLVADVRSLLTRKHPFFAHSEADFFLAESDGSVLGRIAVLEHRRYNLHHGTKRALFYFFDTVDDEEAARVLFGAAFDWAKGRGLDSILGPKGFTRSAGPGMLVEGFGFPPATGIPYNFPYYGRLATAAGLRKWTDHLSGYLDRSVKVDERLYRVAALVEKRGKFSVRAFKSRAELRSELPAVKRIQHEAFADNPNYVPSTDAEFALMARSMLAVADLSVVRFIMKGEEVAGFMAAYPNIGAGLRKARGRLLPLGWLHILRDMRRSRVLDLNGVGILPKFQGLGGNAILLTELERSIRASRYEKADFIQVDERNARSIADIENFSIAWAKRHRSYIAEF
jgi:hypothetical protein